MLALAILLCARLGVVNTKSEEESCGFSTYVVCLSYVCFSLLYNLFLCLALKGPDS